MFKCPMLKSSKIQGSLLYGPTGRLNMNFYYQILSGLQVCRHLFEVRFHPSRNRAIPLPSIISPCGRDVTTLVDIYENLPDNSAVIDLTHDFDLTSD